MSESSAPKLVFSSPKKKEVDSLSWKKILVFGFLGIMAAMVSFMTYHWFIYSATHISTNDSFVETDIWPINSHNMGYIRDVLTKENQVVAKGDILLQLDDRDLQIELKYKRAKYNKGAADFKRAKELARSHMVSKSDIETAEATLVALQADLEGTLLKMDFTKVTAPVNGVVSKIGVHVGQFIQPGQSLMMVVAPKPVWIQANFKETQLSKVRVGLPVEVEIDAFPGVLWHGKIASIYPASGANMSLFPPENSTGNFTKIVQRIPVTIELEEKPGYLLRSGMSAVSTIVLR